ncbi:MAG: 4Fe-4S binding protein [Bacillota bacterium]|nr:4Fe-4S binding protein [Bacillota bacterium]
MITKKFKLKPVSVIRIIMQILFFIFLPSLYISTFSGIKEIYLSIYNGNFNFLKLFPQLVEVIAIIPITILLGRFFCGWMCAFGALGDFMSFISRKLFKRKFKINKNADKILKYLKYVWLIILVVFVWSLGAKTFANANPWDAFGMLLTPGSMPDFKYVITNLTVAFIILVGILAASLFIDRFFCRYLCPLGAIFAIVSKLRLTKIKKPSNHCGKCKICTENCPMGIPLNEKDSSKSGECIYCFKCTSKCPRQNVSFAVAENSVRPLIAGTVATAVITGAYYAGAFTSKMTTDSIIPTTPSTYATTVSSEITSSSTVSSESATVPATSSSPVSSSASSSIKDGVYQGSGTGYRGGTTTVSVTVKNGKISDISVISTQDDQEFFDRAYSVISQEIISSQSTQVDTVSGATYSSMGIMDAVANALEKA